MKEHGNTSEDVLTTIREHRETLETLAESDLPAAPWAERLLALLDDSESKQRGNSL